MSRTVIHVIPLPASDAWEVRRAGDPVPTSRHLDQAEAEEAASQRAFNEGADIRVHARRDTGPDVENS